MSGILRWSITVLVGIGSGVIVLGLAQRYTDQQKTNAIHAAQVRAYKSSIAACKRGNTLRRNLNDTTLTQLEFLNAALIARRRAVETAKTDADRVLNADAAHTYERLIAHAHLAQIIDCKHAFTKP